MKYESRYFHIISMLPAHISMPPAITFGETGSFRSINASMIVSTTLSLSTGATRDTSPIWIALK